MFLLTKRKKKKTFDKREKFYINTTIIIVSFPIASLVVFSLVIYKMKYISIKTLCPKDIINNNLFIIILVNYLSSSLHLRRPADISRDRVCSPGTVSVKREGSPGYASLPARVLPGSSSGMTTSVLESAHLSTGSLQYTASHEQLVL